MAALAAGSQLGPYEIVAPLGAGGMGEVYRARDTRLGRDVAIKVLPQHLSSNPEIRARFEREAKTISSLNHPNICTLYDVGRAPGVAGSGDTDYLVMELVEGETLAERLRRGPLPAPELLRIGGQIADGLERAHRVGVIHRDLKPANVMLARTGAKLMDFGLSRVTGMTGTPGSSASIGALSQSPTIGAALTAEGTLLGTFQYMSPEQLEGREADARSDVWALGCVLYEMATGRRAFEGRSQASLIAAILEREPGAIAEAPSGTTSGALNAPPPGFDRLVRNCLAKDPDERIQTAHDVKLQLRGLAEGAGISTASTFAASAITATSPSPRSQASLRLAWSIAALALIAAGATLAWQATHRPATPPPVRFTIDSPSSAIDVFWPRVSPDGRMILFQTIDSASVMRVYVRPLDQLQANPIPGTENLQRAYWSPDSREIAYVRAGRMLRQDLAGGSPVLICPAQGGADLSWGSKGTILMDGHASDSLRAVPAGGGELQPATRIDRAAGETGSAWPCFLPDGEHFLFVGNRAGSTTSNIRLGKLGSLDSKLLGTSEGRIEYAPGDWVLYVRGGALVAQKLDLAAARLTGQPIPLVDGLRMGSALGHFSASANGSLVFMRSGEGNDFELWRTDRAGHRQGSALTSGTVTNPRLSPDGKRLLYERAPRTLSEGGDISVIDLERGTDTKLTQTNGNATTPVWSPDGRRFAYAVHSRGPESASLLRIESPDGLGASDSLTLPAGRQGMIAQWSPGAGLVLYGSHSNMSTATVGEHGLTLHAFLDSTTFTAQEVLSPDEHWVAYTTGDFPNIEIFVQSLTGSPGRWQVSKTPGINATWTRNGREILYEGLDGKLMGVDIDTRNGFHAGNPHVLFALPRQSTSINDRTWNADASGNQLFLIEARSTRLGSAIEVVTGFSNLVSRK